MCDFSLTSVKSRPAVVGDKLMVNNFATGSRGFAEIGSSCYDPHATAVCLLPGTELAFAEPIKLYSQIDGEHTTAIFRQLNKDKPMVHHDYIELPDGSQHMLTQLREGQYATVLQLPAAPKTDAERDEQRRAEFIG